MDLADSGRVPRARPYLGCHTGRASPFAYGTFTLYGWAFQPTLARLAFVTSRTRLTTSKMTPATPNAKRVRTITDIGFGLIPFRSPLLGKSLLLSVPAGTKMFQFSAWASAHYIFMCGYYPMTGNGFPHWEIPGSKLVWQLPEAYRSLPRPSSPSSA